MQTTGSTSTYQRIWDVVRQIPKGKVASYGDIAKLSGFFGQARKVGYSLHALPQGSNVPWHRVINSQGRISLPRTSGHYSKQKDLLEKEGVVFKKGRVDLREFGWLQSINDDLKRQRIRPESGNSGSRAPKSK
jgi:methylated-DNA-protein-cysteine methyltransferase-like protein